MLDWLFHTAGGIFTTVALSWLGVMTPLTYAITHYLRRVGLWNPIGESVFNYDTREYVDVPYALTDLTPDILAGIFWPIFWMIVLEKRVIRPTLFWVIIKPIALVYKNLAKTSEMLAINSLKANPIKTKMLLVQRRIEGTMQEIEDLEKYASACNAGDVALANDDKMLMQAQSHLASLQEKRDQLLESIKVAETTPILLTSDDQPKEMSIAPERDKVAQ